MDSQIIHFRNSGKEYNVQVAKTGIQRALGLMFKKSLGPYDGMLFIFPKAGKQDIWMMNVRLNLDILWIDKDGKILKIEPNATSKTPMMLSPANILYVLELPAGTTKKDGIALEDIISLSQ